ncbi:hypothetical protein O0544_15755 [Edwardsiella anguillarum]|nr:hypothetical protein [Edwardsiella anguillarum]
MQQISARQNHQLRRVTLFSPALCRVRQVARPSNGVSAVRWRGRLAGAVPRRQ